MTDERPKPYADALEAAKPVEPEALADPSYEEFQFPTGTIVAMGIATLFVGLIVLCSAGSLSEMASNYRRPGDMLAGLLTAYSVMGLLGVAGASLFLVLIEFRRRLFLILTGVALAAATGLCLIAFFVYQ